eukprot:COSAG01_NODE_6180_length_3806_cov_35.350958_7_plen_73_part_01
MTARIVSSSFRMDQGGAATASGTLQWDVGSNSGDISGLHASDARRLTRAPSNLATFDLRAETMFWAVENPSPS